MGGYDTALAENIPPFFALYIAPVGSGMLFAWVALRVFYKRSLQQAGCQWVDPQHKDGIAPQLAIFDGIAVV